MSEPNMTTWGELEVGSRIIHSADDFDGEYVVKVLKRGGMKIRAVLEAVTHTKAAKVAVRVGYSEEVELAAGAAAPDRPGSAVVDALGGVEVQTMTLADDGVFVSPAVGVTTVAAHLRIMHGIELQGLPSTEEHELLRHHEELHDAPFHEPPFPHRHEEKSDG